MRPLWIAFPSKLGVYPKPLARQWHGNCNTPNPKESNMKTLILSAAIVSTLAFVATHSHANARPVIAIDSTIYVPEQTIVADAPTVEGHAMVLDVTPITIVGRKAPKAAHVETYDEHVKRLMTATPEMVSCASCFARKPFESVSGHVSHLGDR
jgi:hypothetical protein